MIYMDASVVVAALTPEENNDRAFTWLERQLRGSLCVSGWVVTEVSSALARKKRTGELTLDERAAVLAKWTALRATTIAAVPVPEEAYQKAAQLIDHPRSVLRAGDALHLAVAYLGDHSLATLDNRLADAAVAAGVPVSRIA